MKEFGSRFLMIEKLKTKQPTRPWWFLFTFDNPLRKIYQNLLKILSPYIDVGDTVVALGCGMGYFSIPMAEPYIHVSRNKFREIESQLNELGFSILGSPMVGFSRCILVKKDQ